MRAMSTKPEPLDLDIVTLAAHELRTPLTIIRGYLELVEQQTQQIIPLTNLEYIVRARVASEQLRYLINNLLNISRIERGNLKLELAKVDLAKLAIDNVRDQSSIAKMREQKIEYEGPANGAFALADPFLLSEVINNLVSNAIKYTQSGGQITVRVRSAGNQIEFAVEDNGPGISQDAMPRLFSRFYQETSSTTSGQGGTGLGLYISKTIIDLHGGHITAKSAGGKGSAFSFQIPAFDPSRDKPKLHPKPLSISGWYAKNTLS